ncbi:hypothetical protein B0T24DRAFT_717172 [Lasiosphaeria ovina]|uniref:Peptidase metallopeptidase domain-containing protein n=1 Tax=Lasiosphaeria ovina TaxID=92902 RepID=A0AAE0NDS2_9PEZI|nr:hypothetical protein B0T24DRAFT_717172 [Lasiosphaeria ovina]
MRAVDCHQPPELTKDELKMIALHCTTECAIKTSRILSARAGHENMLPRWKPHSVVTFAFLEESFPTPHNAACVESALSVAVDDWNSRRIHVRLQRVAQDERPVFVVAYRGRKRQDYAKAFFPNFNFNKRVLKVFEPALSVGSGDFLAVILCHELGHILGLRHDNADVVESGYPSVELTPPNPHSIMMSPLFAGTKVGIQESDVKALNTLYSMDNKSTLHGFPVVTIDPGTLEQPSHEHSRETLHEEAGPAIAGAQVPHAQEELVHEKLASSWHEAYAAGGDDAASQGELNAEKKHAINNDVNDDLHEDLNGGLDNHMEDVDDDNTAADMSQCFEGPDIRDSREEYLEWVTLSLEKAAAAIDDQQSVEFVAALERDSLDALVLPTCVAPVVPALGGCPILTVPLGFLL